MKRAVVLLTLMAVLSAFALAQTESAPQATAQVAPQVRVTNIVERPQGPTYSDLYCAGFISHQPVSKSITVAGGWDTPHQTRFVDREYVYLKGSGFEAGSRYSIVRELRDPNHYEVFRGQRSMLRATGQPYGEIGRVQVVAVRGNIAVTQVEFNCETMVPGDIAAPFVEKPPVSLRSTSMFDRFSVPNGKLTGKIVMAKEFDSLAGMGQKVYLNVGANQGVKVGDYFRVVRTYDSLRDDEVDALSFKASTYEDTQKSPPQFTQASLKDFPRLSLGELLILNVTPTSATGMVTLSLQEIHLGDGVELEEAPAPAPAASAAAVSNPPSIACFASPSSVRVGERSTITCQASSPDNRPLSFFFTASRGQLAPHDNVAVLDTNGLAPGPVSVQSTVTDDRNLSAAANSTLSVEAAPAPPAPSKVGELQFKRNSAYVDNTAKAILDDVALRLQREPDSTLTIVGVSESGEATGLAQRRAANARDYLTRSKGIDSQRVQPSSGEEAGRKADVWLVPAGANMQQAAAK